MRALLPEPRSDVDLHAVYAWDWVERGGVRVNFVSSVDGAVAVGGTSAGLQTSGDNAVFAALRDLADVVVAGASTVVGEDYKPAHPSPARRAARERFGLRPVLPIGVVSRSLSGVDPSASVFHGADDGARTLVFTSASSNIDVRSGLGELADVIVCGEQDVDPFAVRHALAERGLTRVLCEGGPTLFASWARAGAVDELCLTLSPLLAGPGAGRITAGDEWGDGADLALSGLLEQDGALFARYVRHTR